MPYPHEVAARIKDPKEFDEFRRENGKFGDGIDAIFGIKDGKSEVQAVRFDSSKFDVSQVKDWLKSHDMTAIEVEPAAEPKKDSSGTRVFRTDSAPLKSHRIDNAGFLVVDAPIGAVGIVKRYNADGKLQREFRSPEELFNIDSMETAKFKPVTNSHPTISGGVLSPDNVNKVSVGTVGENIRQDGDLLMAPFAIQNRTAIKAVQDGKREISAGYYCDLDDTPGTYNGEPYDKVQRNIEYNHVAVVHSGRAGKRVAIKMDGNEDNEQPEGGSSMMKKLNLDGIDYEVPPEVEKAYNKLSLSKDAADAAVLVGKNDLEKAHGERDALRLQLDSAEKSLSKTISARVALAAQVKKIVGDKFKLDSYDELDLKKAAIGAKLPNLSLDSKEAGYIDGVYASVLALDEKEMADQANTSNSRVEGNAKEKPVLKSNNGQNAPDSGKDADGDIDPRQKMINAQKNKFEEARKAKKEAK